MLAKCDIGQNWPHQYAPSTRAGIQRVYLRRCIFAVEDARIFSFHVCHSPTEIRTQRRRAERSDKSCPAINMRETRSVLLYLYGHIP